jgi:hypothetical protein
MDSSTSAMRELLRPGERLLWSGQPNVRGYVLQGGWFLIPFTLVWLAFAVFWEATAILGGAPIFFWLWGGMFVAIGLYIAFGRLWVASREAHRTTYAVTDDRIVVVSGAFGQRLAEAPLDMLTTLSMERRRDGRGLIHFTDPGPWQFWLPGWPGSRAQPLGFYAVEDVDRVFRIIEQAREEARARARRS